MNTTIDTNQWCSQFKKCKGCNLDAECMVKPEEMALVVEDGKIVDKWAVRTATMIERELKRKNGNLNNR
ncbi:antirestriction Ral family protein [Proteus sp. TJ1640]|uniref:antirestriction Ral family protein n=1 Tax=Proteus sp. TJ1640 TaxID=2050968 RepID=UPI000D69D574|nr:antirestriction Ral family protein [Proteus sp. TJ1640]